jgi:hypothetical protein
MQANLGFPAVITIAVFAQEPAGTLPVPELVVLSGLPVLYSSLQFQSWDNACFAGVVLVFAGTGYLSGFGWIPKEYEINSRT